MSVKVEVWGDYACFSRPELKVERVSYECMTPSAARGILDAIFFHPGMRWVIDKIHILSPIQFTSIRRNEVASKISVDNVKKILTGKANKSNNGNELELFINTKKDIQQRTSVLLKNVHYVIEAHFELTENANESDNAGKFQDIMRRRLEKGQYYHQPYFGCREFPVKFRKWEFDSVPTASINRDLGFMLYDMDYSDKNDIKPMFFRAVVNNGVLNLTDCEVYR